MKFLNNHGLPGVFYRAIVNDKYSPGKSHVTVTELMEPAQAVFLKKKYGAEIEKDVADMLYAMIGKVVHEVLEHHGSGVSEKRMYMKIDYLGDKYLLGGKFDNLDISIKTDKDITRFKKVILWIYKNININSVRMQIIKSGLFHTILTDYKVASVYEYINGVRPEKELQLNFYRELMLQNGFKRIDELRICFIFRDWSAVKAEIKSNYPKSGFAVKGAGVLPRFIVDDMINTAADRVISAKYYGIYSGCSDAEMWNDDKNIALMHDKKTSAIKKFYTEEDLREYVADWPQYQLPGHYIEKRNSAPIRCRLYCDAKSHCQQFQNIKSKSAKERIEL